MGNEIRKWGARYERIEAAWFKIFNSLEFVIWD
jgi:hypothetical protein